MSKLVIILIYSNYKAKDPVNKKMILLYLFYVNTNASQ